MRGFTIGFTFHGFRGFRCVGGPLSTVSSLGWMSVEFVPLSIGEWLRVRTNALKNAISAKKVHQSPQETMAVWREDKPIHRRVN